MTYITDINEINKLMRNKILEQSGLNSQFVINSLSLYGVELQKRLSGTIFNSTSSDENLILFELLTKDGDNNQNFTEEDNDKIITYRSFKMHFIIYGNGSQNLATILSARFRTMQVIEDMYKSGINIEKVSIPESANEFINSKLWIRTDFDINLSVALLLEQKSINTRSTLPGLIVINEN